MRMVMILFFLCHLPPSITIFLLIWHSSWPHFLFSHSIIEVEKGAEEEEEAEHLFSMIHLLLQCLLHFFNKYVY